MSSHPAQVALTLALNPTPQVHYQQAPSQHSDPSSLPTAPLPKMSAAPASTNPNTAKATTNDPPSDSTLKDQQKPVAVLEEDDEFEDFPVDGEVLSFTTGEASSCADHYGTAQQTGQTRIKKFPEQQ